MEPRDPNTTAPVTAATAATAVTANPATPAAPRPLVIVTDTDDVFPYRPKDDAGNEYGSTLYLRIVPEEVQEALRKKHTRMKKRRGGAVPEVDIQAAADDEIDYAITSWGSINGVRLVEGRKEVFPLECTRQNKLKLPERIKTDVYRMCSNRELGDALTEDDGDEGEGESGGPGGGSSPNA
jgi:hypothetical protein